MKKFLFLILLIFQCISKAQDIKFIKPNYEEIKQEIKDTRYVYYYPKLMKKFDSADFTTTLEENRYLYYGFVFQKDYESQYDSKYIDKIKGGFTKKRIV